MKFLVLVQLAKISFFLSPTVPNEIEAIVLSFNNSKSVGPYSITVKLKFYQILFPIHYFIITDCECLLSFSDGVCPNKLKIVKVVALHKKGDSDISISLLSVFRKIIVIKLMHKR